MPFRSRSRNNQRRQLLKRHGKSKFSEGEVVLCYEPDPAKTKVLYSSKVIQIVEKYDDNDKRYEEYLIHFHGWNSTWDRYVTEDFILKDTPENRKLQQELANEAQLTPGGNLYKRDLRHRRRSSNQRRRSRNSENAYNSNTQRSFNDEEGISQGETTQDEYSSDKSSDDEGMSISLKEIPPLPIIHIPAVIKKALGYDEHLITIKKKLLKLPSEPTIISVLESFVHHYVTHGLRSYISKQTRKLKYEDLVSRVSLCKEMVDGLRVIFDFTFDNLLMYHEEKAQFIDTRIITLDPPIRTSTCVLENEIKDVENNLARDVKVSDVLPLVNDLKNSSIVKRVLRSQHHQQNFEQNEVHSSCQDRMEKQDKVDKLDKLDKSDKHDKVDKHDKSDKHEKSEKHDKHEKPDKLDKQEKSDKHAKSEKHEKSDKQDKSDKHDKSENLDKGEKRDKMDKQENSTPFKKEEIQNSMASSSCSSNGIVPPYNLRFDGSIIYNRHIKKLIQKEIQDWKLVPDYVYAQKPLKPSLVYGATHLARLFVKLPEILQYSAQRQEATEIVIEYSEMLLNFLAEHIEWFGDDHYVCEDFKIET